MLEREIVKDYRDGFQLSNNVRIAILTASHKLVRGFSLISCILDEAAFLGTDSESEVKSDTELVNAVRPSLSTCNGRLITISSPYARKGFCWTTFKRYYGNNSAPTLVWNSPSRTMNPTLPEEVIAQAMQEDRAAALSEYGGQFRDDVSLFLPVELIEQFVVNNRFELLPRTDTNYSGFADVSGGRHDDAALSIGHRIDKKIVIDCIKRYQAPHVPTEIIRSMCDTLKSYGIKSVVGDAYAAEFTIAAFRSNGIRYNKSQFNKSEIFLEFLPILCSGAAELLHNEDLIKQLSNLERRTRSGGKDMVAKPVGGRDDVANVVSGVCTVLSKPKFVAGGWRLDSNVNRAIFDNVRINRQLMARAITAQQAQRNVI